MESNKSRKHLKLLTAMDAASREALISNFRSSGLSQSAFCRQEGISYFSMNHWLRKMRKVKNIQPVQFVEAVVPRPSLNPVEVDLPNGGRVRFHIDARTQTELLRDYLS